MKTIWYVCPAYFEGFFHRPIDLVEKKALRNPYRNETILKTARILFAAVF